MLTSVTPTIGIDSRIRGRIKAGLRLQTQSVQPLEKGKLFHPG